jgi:GTPase SAR1 family protein
MHKYVQNYRPESLANVESQWAKEIKHFCKGVPVILVGNKTDLRDNPETIQSLSLVHEVIALI